MRVEAKLEELGLALPEPTKDTTRAGPSLLVGAGARR